MATTTVEVNDSTYTLVLDGAGFLYSDQEIEYKDGPTQPTGKGNILNPRNQMYGMAGKKIWARSVVFALANVEVSPEA